MKIHFLFEFNDKLKVAVFLSKILNIEIRELWEEEFIITKDEVRLFIKESKIQEC